MVDKKAGGFWQWRSVGHKDRHPSFPNGEFLDGPIRIVRDYGDHDLVRAMALKKSRAAGNIMVRLRMITPHHMAQLTGAHFKRHWPREIHREEMGLPEIEDIDVLNYNPYSKTRSKVYAFALSPFRVRRILDS